MAEDENIRTSSIDCTYIGTHFGVWFETRPFVDERLSYFRLHATPQETNFDQWHTGCIAKNAHHSLWRV